MNDILAETKVVHSDPSLRLIIERDTLIALTDYNSTNYFIYRGEPMGYQFEMLNQFAEFLDVNLKLVISDDMHEAFDLLDRGEIDVIAMRGDCGGTPDELAVFVSTQHEQGRSLLGYRTEFPVTRQYVYVLDREDRLICRVIAGF